MPILLGNKSYDLMIGNHHIEYLNNNGTIAYSMYGNNIPINDAPDWIPTGKFDEDGIIFSFNKQPYYGSEKAYKEVYENGFNYFHGRDIDRYYQSELPQTEYITSERYSGWWQYKLPEEKYVYSIKGSYIQENNGQETCNMSYVTIYAYNGEQIVAQKDVNFSFNGFGTFELIVDKKITHFRINDPCKTYSGRFAAFMLTGVYFNVFKPKKQYTLFIQTGNPISDNVTFNCDNSDDELSMTTLWNNTPENYTAVKIFRDIDIMFNRPIFVESITWDNNKSKNRDYPYFYVYYVPDEYTTRVPARKYSGYTDSGSITTNNIGLIMYGLRMSQTIGNTICYLRINGYEI